MTHLGTVAFASVVVLTVAVHFAFIGYLVIGGFLAWRWPVTIALHGVVVLWGVAGLLLGLPCPLTDLERFARTGAGMAPLPPQGFIEHYITGVWYPERFSTAVQVLVLAVVLASWVGFSIRGRKRPEGKSGR